MKINAAPYHVSRSAVKNIHFAKSGIANIQLAKPAIRSNLGFLININIINTKKKPTSCIFIFISVIMYASRSQRNQPIQDFDR